MNRLEKLRRIKAKKEKIRRLSEMQDLHFNKSKGLTTPVQELRKSVLLSSMLGNYRQ